jgi:hypothetical protein
MASQISASARPDQLTPEMSRRDFLCGTGAVRSHIGVRRE